MLLHFITLQQKVAEHSSESILSQAEHRSSHGKTVFLQDFLPLGKFKDSECLELSITENSRLLYDVRSHALLTVLEMVSNSSGGAGEVVS